MRRPSTRFLAATLATLAAIGAGCFPGSTAEQRASLEIERERFRELPAWVLDTPSEPGIAIYTVGVAAFQGEGNPPASAIVSAMDMARAEIDENLKRGAEFVAEKLAETFPAITAEALAPAMLAARVEVEFVRQFVSRAPDPHGVRYVYVLAKQPLAGLADALAEHMRESTADVTAAAIAAWLREWMQAALPARDLPAAGDSETVPARLP